MAHSMAVKKAALAVLLLVALSAGAQVNLYVSPNTIKLTSGQTQQFTAVDLTTKLPASVTWFSCASNAVSNTGLFTAPVVKSPSSICVYAISTVDPSKSGTSYATVSPVPLVADIVGSSLTLSSGDKQIIGLPVVYAVSGSSTMGMLKTISMDCGDGQPPQVQNLNPNPANGTVLTIRGFPSFSSSVICYPVKVGALKPSLTITDDQGKVATATTTNTTLPVYGCGTSVVFGYTLPSWITALTWTNPADVMYGGTKTNPINIPVNSSWVAATYTLPNYGKQYCMWMAAGGGTPPYTFTGTNLPPGLTVSNVTDTQALMNGIATTAGVYSFTLTVTDSKGTAANITKQMQVCVMGPQCTGFGN